MSEYKKRQNPWLTTVFVAILGASAQAGAQVPKQNNNGSDQALKKAQGMLRQLNEEKLALAAEKQELQAKLQQLEARVNQLQPLQLEVERQRAGSENLKSANQSLASQLQQAREQEKILGGKWREYDRQAKLTQADNQQLVAIVKEREEREKQCVENNRQLVAEGQALIEQIDDKSVLDVFGEAEPFTGIGRVKTETVVQDYRFKLEDLKVTPVLSDTIDPAP